VDERVLDFVGLAREQLAASFESLGHLGKVSANALRIDAVG